MIISYFHHSGDNKPAHLETSWEQLVESLSVVRPAECTTANCKRSECIHKNGPAWSAARYHDGKTRAVANVVDVHALIVDLDHVQPDDLRTFNVLEQYKKIVCSSHSDSPEDRCLRVILPVSRPVPAKDWYRLWGAAIKLLGIPADKQVKDPSRLYYLPSRPSDACHEASDGSGFTYEFSDGDVLDVDALLASTPAPDIELVDTDFEIPTFAGAPSKDKLEKASQLLGGAWPDSGRNTAQLALCGALARAGWPVDLIADFVTKVCEIGHPGNGDHSKRLKSARASVSKVQNGEFVAGWPTLEDLVDPDTVKEAVSILGLGGPKHDQSFVDAMRAASIHDNNMETHGTLVTVTRDDIDCALKAAKKRLGRSTVPSKLKDALLIGRVLDGTPLTEHQDEDADQALISALKTVIKYTPRGASTLVLAEYFIKNRPDIPVEVLCQMIDSAKDANAEDLKAELPPDEFLMELGKPSSGAQHNFEIALRRLGVSFHFDCFSRKKIIERIVGEDLYREVVEDAHVNQIMFEIEQQFEFFPPKDKFYAYCDYRARQNSFHPVLDYLDSLEPWDNVPRSETWLIECGGAPDTAYVRAVSRLVLVAAVRRVRQPGCKFDEMLILESPQGSYKSTAIKTLCPKPEWFADNFHLDGDTKKMIEQTSGKWIVEAGELKGMSSKDQNTLKAYLSSTVDEARMAYAREAQRLPRQFIIIGTTNDTQYLKDHTGDRRYWPVRVDVFNIEKLAAMRDQLWAEACYLEAENPDSSYIRLDPSLYAAAAVEQSHRKVDNPVKVRLEEYLADKVGRIKTSDTWKLLTEDPVPSQSITTQASNAMQELGWQKIRIQVNNKRTHYYVKGTDSEQKKLLIVTGNMSFGLVVKEVQEDDTGNPIIETVIEKTLKN